jgi:Fur family transcriptional regulator, ferric uptake regulator
MYKRNTSQRKILEDIIASSETPLSVQDILSKGKKRIRSLNQATVYRNLKIFVENEWLKVVSHPTLGHLYEIKEKDHHHHFHCQKCDKVYQLDGCPLKKIGISPPGFVLEDHEVYLSGICANCNRRWTIQES